MRRGQESGSGAAALVALIALFVLLFIVFLPPQERARILDEGSSSLDSRPSELNTSDKGRYLLLENPGTILPPHLSTFTYPISPIEISSLSESAEIERYPTIRVKRSLFSQVYERIPFMLAESENVENLLLNFKVLDASGNLIVMLNGREVYNRAITTTHIEPLSLPISLLKEDNVLEFYAQPLGAAFWSVNQYKLADITLHATVKKVSSAIGEATFYVPNADVDRLRSARLFYLPVCSKDRGTLSITLNGVSVYSATPVCNSIVAVDFSPELLSEGNNKVRFRTDAGAYSLNQIRVSSQPRPADEYVYYFKVGPRLFDDALFGTVNVVASLKFVDKGSTKNGKLVVNGYVRTFEVRESGYAIDISDFLEEGFNAIQIIPEEPLQVIELRVDIE